MVLWTATPTRMKPMFPSPVLAMSLALVILPCILSCCVFAGDDFLNMSDHCPVVACMTVHMGSCISYGDSYSFSTYTAYY